MTHADPPLTATISVRIARARESPREAADMDPDLNPERLVGKLDDLVAPAAEPENAILVDQSRLVRWAGPSFALFSLVMLPWIAYIALSLPSRQLSPNYDIAWAGFDVPGGQARRPRRAGGRAGERDPGRSVPAGPVGRPVVRAVFLGDAAVDRVHRAVAAVPPAVAQLRHRMGRQRQRD